VLNPPSCNARALVERDYDWTAIAERLLSVYDELLAR
jgi:glycosyltransferase involved in cell wall biosynthesis